MRKVFLAVALALVATMSVFPAFAEETEFDICWSHYTGWEPWAYADDSGILKKWADKYGIKIRLDLINDYIESINLYTAGKYYACTMTNMDALTIPAVGGIDSTALIIGDFSNGNDGIVFKTDMQNPTMKDLKGLKIMGVELSVSHYLLARGLDKHGLSERDITFVNTSDADIGSIFAASSMGTVVVTWNPILMQTRNEKGANLVFDSSEIPGEIIDMMVVRTNAPDTLKKALAGAWYETMAVMSGRGKSAKEAIAFMAKKSGATVKEFEAQLRTTTMFYNAAGAVSFVKSPQLKETMEYVRTFSFDHGLYGEGAPSKDLVGISFPDGSVLGNPNNVKLRFDATYMQMIAENKL